jgi:hypothetical protein
VRPSAQPSGEPTSVPSTQPFGHPSGSPSSQPIVRPTGQPSGRPSVFPSGQPSGEPSSSPSGRPSVQPSSEPTGVPSGQPSGEPSLRPSGQPSCVPSVRPSSQPSTRPSSFPSARPSGVPSTQPSGQPTSQPLSVVGNSVDSYLDSAFSADSSGGTVGNGTSVPELEISLDNAERVANVIQRKAESLFAAGEELCPAHLQGPSGLCASLNRQPCRETNATCGPCNSLALLGQAGDSNTPCISPSTASADVLAQVSREPKVCPSGSSGDKGLEECSGTLHGRCGVFESGSGEVWQSSTGSDFCALSNPLCEVRCECVSGRFGSACELDETAVEQRREVFDRIVQLSLRVSGAVGSAGPTLSPSPAPSLAMNVVNGTAGNSSASMGHNASAPTAAPTALALVPTAPPTLVQRSEVEVPCSSSLSVTQYFTAVVAFPFI